MTSGTATPASSHAHSGILLLGWRPEGRRCVVVGGGPVAARRAADLCEAGGVVEVIAPRTDPAIDQLEVAGQISVQRRPLEASDLYSEGVARQDGILAETALIVVATDDPVTNDLVGNAATELGLMVNRADESGAGNVTWLPAVRRGSLQIGISSGGEAPGVSRLVADRLDDGLDELLDLNESELNVLIGMVGDERRRLRANGNRPARIDWRSEQAETILDLIRSGLLAEAKERLQAWQSL